MDDFNFIDIVLNVLGMAPQHGENEIVGGRNGLINVAEEHVEKVLLGKRGGRGNTESVKKGVVGQVAGLEDEHAGVEVERRRGTGGGRPGDSVGTLLAVADGVLRGVAPCLLAEAVHDGVEMAVGVVEEMVYVVVYLDVSIQIYHLLVLHKLFQKNQ